MHSNQFNMEKARDTPDLEPDESPTSSSASSIKMSNDDRLNGDVSGDAAEREVGADATKVPQELDLVRTKSIAETLALPHEVAFVAIVCMAQFFTRKCCG